MNMHNGNNNSSLPNLSRGFSLVELMVALVITLILLAGIGQIFLSSKKSFVIQDSLGRLQENGRYAMETLAQDVRRAGFWGGNADITAIDDHVGGTGKVATDDGTCTDVNWARMLTHRIFGKNDTRAGYTCLPPDTSHKGDILVVRYAAPWEVGDVTTPSFQDDQFYLRSSLFEGRLFKGSDHDQSVNTIDAPAVRTAELVSHGYFIHTSESSDPNKCTGSDAVPSLYRMTPVIRAGELKLEAEEIAYGVDDFQVQYLVDTDKDNSVDDYFEEKDASDPMWDQVIAARIWLLVRAECPETGYTNDTIYRMAGTNYTYNDGYRRQLYTSTIRLRNR
ncbi:MAG: PilW family protein [Gammaproteobacteria bacterium]